MTLGLISDLSSIDLSRIEGVQIRVGGLTRRIDKDCLKKSAGNFHNIAPAFALFKLYEEVLLVTNLRFPNNKMPENDSRNPILDFQSYFTNIVKNDGRLVTMYFGGHEMIVLGNINGDDIINSIAVLEELFKTIR